MTSKKYLTLKVLLFLVATDVLETFAQFCFKKSTACQDFSGIATLTQAVLFIKIVIFSPFLWMALFSVMAIFIIWSTILSKVDLSVAVPVASFSYILVPLVSGIFLHEKVSMLRWFGIVFILIGVVFVSATTRRKEIQA